ncbi:hypothetical protein [Roseimarinus sediminis]|uniref:hypothetical protein n=1 Tax=Roseimarinus sediminis TaxID=1610899 RepID=UPI003D1DD52D
MTTRLFFSALFVFNFLSLALLGGQRSNNLKVFDWTLAGQLLSHGEEKNNSAEPLLFSEAIVKGRVLQVRIDVSDENFAAAVLNLYFEPGFFAVYVNDELIESELNGDNFHADISRFADAGTILLQLQVKKELDASMLKRWLTRWSVDFHTDVVLCHAVLSDDSFLGGKMLELVVKNYAATDVDGKVYARIYDAGSWELIAENNNCAFSRSGIDASIEISFPEFPENYLGKLVFAEIVMVDKDKNEEVIDQLDLPLRF